MQRGNSRARSLQSHTVLAAIQTFAAVAGAVLDVVAVASTAVGVVAVAEEPVVAVEQGLAVEDLAAVDLAVVGLGSGSDFVANLEADPVEDMVGFARQ